MQNHLFCLGDKQIELLKQTRDENKKKQKEKSSLIFIGCLEAVLSLFCLTSLVQSKHHTWLQTLQRQAYKRSCMIFFLWISGISYFKLHTPNKTGRRGRATQPASHIDRNRESSAFYFRRASRPPHPSAEQLNARAGSFECSAVRSVAPVTARNSIRIAGSSE